MSDIPLRTQRSTGQPGFTLLEVMVVIVIIGIIFSMASLNVFQSTDRQLEEAARRFAALAQLANEEAIINNRNYAVGLSKVGYEFYQLDNLGNVSPVDAGEAAFRQREIPPFGQFEAMINGEDITLPASLKPKKKSQGLKSDEEDKSDIPKIFFLSSGEMTPFEVSIESEEGHLFTVEGDFSGKVKYLGRSDS